MDRLITLRVPRVAKKCDLTGLGSAIRVALTCPVPRVRGGGTLRLLSGL